jgi:hypothetical protein
MASTATISTLGGVWRQFIRHSSPRVMAAGLALVASVRIGIGVAAARSGIGIAGVTVGDLVAVALVVAAVPFVEWAIHLFILHRAPFTVRGHAVDLSASHRQHHLNPASTSWILLSGSFAAVSQVANGLLALAVVGPPLWVLGFRSPLELAGPLTTAVLVAVAALMHYEWSHLLFHTAYRPRLAYYRRLKRNHRLHHYRNERHWLGITGNAADRVLGSYPASRSAVPLSPTARTLGVDPQGLEASGS